MAKKNQVARNERERNRVHQVNAGFDVLRERLQPKSHTKKWSKADTLRQAVKRIQYLQSLLNQDPQQPSVSSTTSPDYPLNTHTFNPYIVKEEFSMYMPQNYHQTPQMPSEHVQNADNSHTFHSSPNSSVSSTTSYSPTQMCYPTTSYVSYPHH
ncbi:CBN-HLH-14 protein [Caenorhabditis brenneri]|uniref:CBN-HLH-14 protein n=1 Tax=Caenorhabditis brenneri TaxID=135651 RepID=G0NAS8_CAEBE|nr:CBN-HLH-14 protein [Caenorhabditis brenneri]